MKFLPKLFLHTLLSAMGAIGTILCLTSAFSISISLPAVVLAALLASALFSACFIYKKFFWSLIPLALLLFFLAFFTDLFAALSPTLIQLMHDIMSRFSSAYPNISFYIPALPDPIIQQSNTLLFSVLAVLLSLWIAWGVGYRSCIICIAGTIPFLLLCVVINDTPPAAMPLVIILTVWLTVLMSKTRSEEAPYIDVIRTVLTLTAVFLVLTTIGVTYPKDDTSTRDLPELVQTILDRLPGPIQNMLSRDGSASTSEDLGADTSRTLNLMEQGVRDRKDTVILEVSATEEGPLYLRGAAKDIYTGAAWDSSDEASSTESVYAQTSLGTAFGSVEQAAVHISNLYDSGSVLFAPYGYISCTSAEPISSDLRIDILESDYTVYYWPGIRTLDLSEWGHECAEYDDYVMSHCLEIPEATKQELYNLAVRCGYDPSMSTAQTIAWVAEFVRSSGEYKLDVSRQPVNFDFALYFLTQSKAGYCVHFATAAAVMYRALGIPARYASGYRVVITEAGAVTEVTDQDTHAWAEVYLSGLGWIPVETTPGFGETSALPQVEQEISTPPASTPSPSMAATPSPSPFGTGESPIALSPSPSPVEESLLSDSSPGRTDGGFSPLWLLCIPGVLLFLLLAVILRRSLLRQRRKKFFAVTNPNQAVLNLWQYVSRLSSWGAELPPELEVLALKAKFSPHTITQEELQFFQTSVRSIAVRTASRQSGLKKLRFKFWSVLDD